jgi:translocator protein
MMSDSQPSTSSPAAPAPESPRSNAATPVDEDRSFNKFNFINLIAYLLNVFVTFAVGLWGLLDTPTNGELSDRYQTIITPAGISFSIWGPIFILQALWVVWQLLPSQRNSPGVLLVGWNYMFAVIFQCGWTFAFAYEVMWLSLVCMYGILFFLVSATMTLNRNYTDKVWKGYLLWQFPISLHCGWIIAASAVNTNLLPVFYGASGTVQLGIASTALVVVATVALSWLASYPVDFAIPAVAAWALGGVYLSLEDPSDLLVATFPTSQLEGFQYGVIASFFLILAAILAKCVYVLCVQRPNAVAAKSAGASAAAANAGAGKDAQSEATDEENPAQPSSQAVPY